MKAGRNFPSGWLAAGIVASLGIALFIVIAFVALFSWGSEPLSLPPLNYLIRLVFFTFEQALLSTFLSVSLAIPFAMALARRLFPGRSLLVGLLWLPQGLPVLPAIFGILEIWGRTGWINSLLSDFGLSAPVSIYGLPGILIAHIFFNLPLAARVMLGAIENIPRDEWKLAASLNMGRFAIFRWLEWPAILRVIPGIAGLILMLCITSFTIILTLGGGPQSSTLEVAIYQSLKFDFEPARALALTFIQLALTAACFSALRLFPEPRVQKALADRMQFRSDGRSIAAVIGDVAIIVVFILFISSPLFFLLLAGLEADIPALVSSGLFRQALETSLVIALFSASVGLLLSIIVAKAFVTSTAQRCRIFDTLLRIPHSTLLFPPVALGAGWFVIANGVGLESMSLMAVVGSINVLMAIPFQLRILEPEIRIHYERTARLAQSLGIRGMARLRIVDLPPLGYAFLTTFAVGMSLSLGDLGAAALFANDEFMTLPTLLYAKLGSYRSHDAAGIASLLALACIALLSPAFFKQTRR